MKEFIVAGVMLGLAACGGEGSPPAPPSAKPAPERPEKLPNGEPAAVRVKHVLIAFKGSERSKSDRSPEEAEKLAYEVLGRARSGEDFDALMKSLSDDTGGGDYAMANTGVATAGGEFSRTGMAKAFGDVSFRLGVGEIGLADYHKDMSPFGYHIIKRVK